MNKIIGSLIILASILLPMQLGMDLSGFNDIPSLMIVLGISLGVIIVRHGNGAIKQLFDGDNNLEVVNSLFTAAYCAAIIANLVAMVTLLSQLGDAKAVGPAIAVAVLSTFYATLITLLCISLNKQFTIDGGKGLLILAPVIMGEIFYVGALSITV